MITPEEIESALLKALPGAIVKARDTTGTYDHYHVLVVATQFSGLPRVKRHQMVYAPLSEALKGALHAIQLETYTTEEWGKIKSSVVIPA